MPRLLPSILLALACAACAHGPAPAETVVVRPSASTQGPREALLDFVGAAEAGDFERAYALLTGRLRARYTPERLARDYSLEPLSRERLRRATLAADGEPVIEGERAAFPIGDGFAVRLEREGGSWRVESLE